MNDKWTVWPHIKKFFKHLFYFLCFHLLHWLLLFLFLFFFGFWQTDAYFISWTLIWHTVDYSSSSSSSYDIKHIQNSVDWTIINGELLRDQTDQTSFLFQNEKGNHKIESTVTIPKRHGGGRVCQQSYWIKWVSKRVYRIDGKKSTFYSMHHSSPNTESLSNGLGLDTLFLVQSNVSTKNVDGR